MRCLGLRVETLALVAALATAGCVTPEMWPEPPVDVEPTPVWADGREPCGVAKDYGWDWLARHQSEDGTWSAASYKQHCVGSECRGAVADVPDARTTALVLLNFLGTGQTPHIGEYRDVVGNGLEALVRLQSDGGWFAPPGDRRTHAMATLALARAYALTLSERVHGAANRAVEVMGQAEPSHVPDTISWEALALMTAERAGLAVRTRPLRNRLTNEMRQFFNPMGCFCHESDDPPIESPRDAAHLLAAYVALGIGIPSDGDAGRAAEVLDGYYGLGRRHPDGFDPEITCLATWALHSRGVGTEWRRWNERIKPFVVDRQDHVHAWPTRADPVTGLPIDRISQSALFGLTLTRYYASGTVPFHTFP